MGSKQHGHRGGGGGQQLSSVGGGGGELLGGGSPPTPHKRTPDLAAKKCDSGLKSDLGNFTTKLKIEPGDSSPHDCGLTDAELTARRLAALSDSDHLSPRKDGMIPPIPPPHYSDKYGVGGVISKEECLSGPHGHPGPMSGMSLEPNLHHLSDPSVTCNNFSVDSIMTTGGSRDSSPQPPPGPLPTGGPGPDQVSGYRGHAPWGSANGHSPTYPACLYPGPGQTSLEELSSMTAACLNNQSQMSSLYSRTSWYTMPGHHSPSNIVNPDQTFPQPRADYFEPLGKAPSPLPSSGCDQVPYRSPTYRTSYYSQDCEKY